MSSNQSKDKLLLLHNVIAPYRIPLFEELSKRYDLTVMFCSQKAKGRNWSTTIGKVHFHYKILRNVRLLFFVLNPGLPFYLLRQKVNAYIIIDDEENFFSNLCIVIFAKLARKPYILWSGHIPIEGATIHPIDFHHTALHRWPIKNIFRLFTERTNQYLYDHASSFLAYSDMSKRYLVSHGVDPKNISVSTQAMAQELMPTPKRTISLNANKLQLLYVGYFRPEKGIDILIKAVLSLPASKVELHIVGDGPEKVALQELTGNAKNIKIHPYVQSVERANWLNSVDISVLPTYFDPWAHVITESLYYGTPVVVTSSAAASSIIRDGYNGFVVTAGDINQLRMILQALIDNPAQLTKMKEFLNENKDMSLYDVSSNAKNFVDAYAEAIKRKHKV